MKSWGCNVTAGGIYFAEVEELRVINILKLVTPDTDARGLTRSFETVKAILSKGPKQSDTNAVLGVFGSTSGSHGSSVETIKAEAVVQLAADSLGIRVDLFHPASFYKIFKDSPGKNWSERARNKIDPKKAVLYWSSGSDGAVCAAIRTSDPKILA